jgi:hypothetical protein
MASCVQNVWRSRQNAAMMLEHVDQFFRDAIGAGPKSGSSMQVQSQSCFMCRASCVQHVQIHIWSVAYCSTAPEGKGCLACINYGVLG